MSAYSLLSKSGSTTTTQQSVNDKTKEVQKLSKVFNFRERHQIGCRNQTNGIRTKR